MIVKNTKEYFVGFLGRIKNKGYKVELKEMIKVMQHYENGGVVKYSTNNFNTIVGTANKKGLVI